MESGADLRWMERAIELAARGRFGASPNPLVGAVVIDAEGRKAGEGYHEAYGGPHAEIMALNAAGEAARDGTLFVTLEPCAHHGKTPPCVDAILAARLRRVVVAVGDPNPVATGGIRRLEEAGLEVNVGQCHDSACQLNRRWLKWADRGTPWVTMKAATSLDGRIATSTGESKWITGEAARHQGHILREEHDAILVGVGTVLADDPRLTRRLGLNPNTHLKRIVLDSGLRTPDHAFVVENDPDQTILVHGPEVPEQRRAEFADAGVRLLRVEVDERGRIDLRQLLRRLAEDEIAALLVEGGAEVHGSFCDADLVDEAIFFIAPILIGGTGKTAVAGQGIRELGLAPRLRFESAKAVGDDVMLRAIRHEDEDVHGAC